MSHAAGEHATDRDHEVGLAVVSASQWRIRHVHLGTVTNAGSVPLAGVTVTDDKCSPVTFVSGDTNSNALLDLTETWTFTCTTTITTPTTNTATATGKDAAGTSTSATATATVSVVNSPPTCPPGSTDPNCVPSPCPPGTAGPNCPPVPPAPPKTTLVYECFVLQSRLVPNKNVLLLTKNFGNDTVRVVKSQRMCEPALKTKTQPPTGTTAPVVLPSAELTLDVMDPQGGQHTVTFDGTMAYMKLSPGVGVYDTEMLQLSLESTAPMQVAAPAGSFFDSFFDVFTELDAAATSPGRLNGFFDIFPEMSLSRNMSLGGPGGALHLRPSSALRFVSDQEGSYVLSPAAPIPLNGGNGQPSGWTIGRGTLTPSPTPTPNQVVTRPQSASRLKAARPSTTSTRFGRRTLALTSSGWSAPTGSAKEQSSRAGPLPLRPSHDRRQSCGSAGTSRAPRAFSQPGSS